MPWFGIRSVYLFEARPDGNNIFEERVVVFEAADEEEAHEKAYAERRSYANENGFEAHPRQIAFEQDGEALLDGYEVWSELYESRDSLDVFYERRYGAFEYHGPADEPG